jgi:hypothetical protein
LLARCTIVHKERARGYQYRARTPEWAAFMGAGLQQSGGSAGPEDGAPQAWVLNLDAEHELERGPAATPSAHLRALVAGRAATVAPALLGAEDVWVRAEGLADRDGRPLPPDAAQGLLGRAWSPTPRARALLVRWGATPPAAPDFAVLRRVNARPFTAELQHGVAWREAVREGEVCKTVATDSEQVLSLLGRPAALGWLVRRAFGAAGRGRRRIASGRPTPEERAWLAAGLRLGPLVLEPFVAIVRETTRCAFLRRDGGLTIGAPGFQTTTSGGAWLETTPAEARAVAEEDDRQLLAALEQAGAALAAAGYRGPYGIDAFWHRPRGGAGPAVLQPLSEINARLTMDWTAGLPHGE